VWQLDFNQLQLGRPHHMKFGAASMQVAQR
jgi:hypothetical protein